MGVEGSIIRRQLASRVRFLPLLAACLYQQMLPFALVLLNRWCADGYSVTTSMSPLASLPCQRYSNHHCYGTVRSTSRLLFAFSNDDKSQSNYERTINDMSGTALQSLVNFPNDVRVEPDIPVADNMSSTDELATTTTTTTDTESSVHNNPLPQKTTDTTPTVARAEMVNQLRQQAEQFRAQAQALKQDVAARRLQQQQQQERQQADRSTPEYSQQQLHPIQCLATENGNSTNSAALHLPWSVPLSCPVGMQVRLYIDLGRESGTWMDPRWAASGQRLQFTLDVCLVDPKLQQQQHDKSLLFGNAHVSKQVDSTEATVGSVETAPFARLRQGFDRMACEGRGVYEIKYAGASGKNGTLRFWVPLSGTAQYGDVTIPRGPLLFALPVFCQKQTSIGNVVLSTKPGSVVIRQYGWHTGWWREESRIIGTFRAMPIAEAKQRDGF